MDLTNNFQQIVNLQNEFNKVINPEWQNAGYDFDTAIWVEAIELIDSFHWVWWKDGVDNLANAKVEVVDILHFLLSDWMIENQPNLASNLADSSNRAAWGRWASYRGKGKKYYIYSVKYFLKNHSRLYGVDSIDGFITSLATPLFASPEELINMYLAKNILNKIRQEFGYKLGTYIKMWGDVEDNVIVMQLAEANPEVTFLELLELVRSYYVGKVANVGV